MNNNSDQREQFVQFPQKISGFSIVDQDVPFVGIRGKWGEQVIAIWTANEAFFMQSFVSPSNPRVRNIISLLTISTRLSAAMLASSVPIETK
jgi:hypothetical protein